MLEESEEDVSSVPKQSEQSERDLSNVLSRIRSERISVVSLLSTSNQLVSKPAILTVVVSSMCLLLSR